MRKLKCIVINPQWYDDLFLSFPLGLATITAILKREGYDTIVIDFDAQRIRDEETEVFLQKIGMMPDVVLVGGMVSNYRRIKKIIHDVKLVWPQSIVILGGSLATTAPEQILKMLGADIFVIGEGEETIKLCLEAIAGNHSFMKIPGIKIRKYDGDVVSSGVFYSSPDIEKTPPPAYEDFPMTVYMNFLNRSGRCFEIYSSKGCANQCAFCYKISGSIIRHRLVEDIIDEIKFVREKYFTSRFSFEDDNFGTNKLWLSKFCKLVKKLKIKFRFQANLNILSEFLLEQLQDAGLEGVSFGLESASKLILRQLEKNINLEHAKRIIKALDSRGIKYNATIIIGAPSETDESIETTIDFLVKNKFRDNFQIFFLTPYPGTKLYAYAVKEKYICDEVKYIENLKLQDEININLTKYPKQKLAEWRKSILKETGSIDDASTAGATWKKEGIKQNELE